MKPLRDFLLVRYVKLPERLEAAIAGLEEAQLNFKLEKGGWSIRETVHHIVEGELMWQMFLRAILGCDGIEFPIQWYCDLPQEEWAKRWAYDRRKVGPALTLYRGSTASLVELLNAVPPESWKHYGRVTWPEDVKETQLSVRDIVLMQLRHLDQHAADIQAIRMEHEGEEIKLKGERT